ncbi:MAG: S41 family peptidase, partial [Cyanobacteria bacterium MAG APA_bin_95]|nr:S41 family peptidase [Cyanobacteria bacterium MAG APA_bin_95]
TLYDGPMVVLVNSGTASASEILAGALQDDERAEVMGRPTFGKGLIQTLIPLNDGSGLAVTVARYVTPAGHDIQSAGIVPNQVLAASTQEMPEEDSQDPWLGRAMVALQNQLHRHEKHIKRTAMT